jgi:hypothetical protein
MIRMKVGTIDGAGGNDQLIGTDVSNPRLRFHFPVGFPHEPLKFY